MHGYFSLGKTSGPTTRSALAVRFFSRWCYVRSGVGVSARRIGLAMNRFYTKQTKIYGNFRIWFFLKDPKKLLVAQKINLGHFNLWRRIQHVPKSIIGQMDMNWNTKNKKSEINTFKFHLFMLSSNSWMVRLKAMNLR